MVWQLLLLSLSSLILVWDETEVVRQLAIWPVAATARSSGAASPWPGPPASRLPMSGRCCWNLCRHPGRGRGRNERGGRWWSKLTVAGILSELALTSTESFVKHILTNVYVHINFCSEKLVIFPKIHFVLQNVKISIWSITTFMSCHQVSCDMYRLSCDMSHISWNVHITLHDMKSKIPVQLIIPVSYTHLTLPTNREV